MRLGEKDHRPEETFPLPQPEPPPLPQATEVAGGHAAPILEASPNAILAVDASGRILYANARAIDLFGYTRDELAGANVDTLLPKQLAAGHARHRANFMATPTARPMGIGLDLAGRRRDGTEFPVEISLSPVETEEGRLVFATVADITARKSLENQLLQAQKMESIGRLAGGIAHDFNNMLSAIRGYADLIESDLRSNTRETIDLDDLALSAESISGAVDRAASLTAQLLAFARQQVLQPHVIDLREVVLGVEPMLRRLIGEHIRLVMALDRATGRLRGDRAQIDQIIVNLVINARDAIPDGGTVTVETANHTIGETYAIEHFDVPAGQYVMLSVGDDGVGMDVETRQHIFEPFFTTKEIGKGTGLGLATIFGIVRQSGGHIWLYSEPGRGTIFKLYFPRVDEVVEQPETALPVPSTRGTGHLLVVEDEGQVREVIVRILDRAGYTTTTAPDGKTALDMLEADHTRFAGVISDVVMHGMTGTELANIVLDRFPKMGVVLLSGYTAETLDLADVLTRGAFFLGKPFSADQLAQAVAASTRAGRLSA